jgi:hypothetical protein
MSDLKWKTEKRKLSDLKGFENNPRKLSRKQRTELLRSLEKFDLAEIPAIDTDDTILAGNQRVKLMIEANGGDREIDVRVPNRKLSKDERDEYLLRSNKTTASWDSAALGKHFNKNLLENIGFRADEFEFNSTEISFNENEEFELPDMELKSFEHYDYIVVCFDNTHDWLNALQLFEITKVNDSLIPERKKIGIGRIVDGKRVLQIFDNLKKQK